MTGLKDLQERFFDSVVGGTGEAVRMLRQRPSLAVEGEIWQACITNFAFDAQCESRHEYAWLLIQYHSHREELCGRVVKAVRDGRTASWKLDQLVPLVALIAKDGSEEARQALYFRFQKAVHPSAGVHGDLQIAHLDGVKGFVRIARVIGERLLKDPATEFNDHAFYHGWGDLDRSTLLEGWSQLKVHARKDPAVRAYVQRCRPPEKFAKQAIGKESHSYRALKLKLNSGRKFLIMNERYTTRATISRLCKDFLAESEPRMEARYIALLRPVRMIGARGKLLALLSGEEVDRHSICTALSWFKGKELRFRAMQELRGDRFPEHYPLLLKGTYQPGDAKVIESAARRIPYPRSHTFLQSTLSVYRKNRVQECKGPLEALYARTNCGLCRYELVQLMYSVGVLPERILLEMQFDSNEDTRALYGKVIRARMRSLK